MRWIGRGLFVCVTAALPLVAGWPATPSAYASCVTPPRSSPNRFTGTVTQVVDEGRTATVRTDDGRTVTVHGGYHDHPGVVTTVDRTYQLGEHYEFHPLNDADPYRDNACTATHPIAALPAGVTTPSSEPAHDAAARPSGNGGRRLWPVGIVAAVLVAGLVVLAAGAALRRRHRSA
jgi:hypothetical protein